MSYREKLVVVVLCATMIQAEPVEELAALAGIPEAHAEQRESASNDAGVSDPDYQLDSSEQQVDVVDDGTVAVVPIAASVQASVFAVNEENKKEETVKIVKSMIDFLKQNRTEVAFNAFTHDRQFIRGDVVPFAYDLDDGTIYVRGEDRADIWKDINKYRNKHGIDVMELIRKKARNGGGWVEYEWKNGYKSSYVEAVEKDGRSYLIGAGWFPVNKRSRAIEFVKSAVGYFKKNGTEEAFRRFSNPIGEFVSGDFYLFVYNFDGQCVAHGDNPALIGRDFTEDPLIKSIIDKAKSGGGWIEYQWKGAPKVAYIEKITRNGEQYAIGTGYYPDSNRDSTVGLVKRAVKYFNAWGREAAAREFTVAQGQFIYGDLYIAMYDFNGKCLAHGDDPTLVGQDLMNMRMADGTFVIRELIELAKKGGGWIEYRWKNDILASYVETVSDKSGKYVITAGFYPYSKRELCIEVVRLGMEYLRTHSRNQAFEIFARYAGPFVRGDMSLFIFNQQGDCLVYGDNHDFIWRNFKEFKDADGRRVIELMLDKARKGGGWIEYVSRNDAKLSYVQQIEKDGTTYIIGSSYYK